LAAGGKITTIEVNDELEDISRHYFRKEGIEQDVQMIIGDARSVVPQLNDSFDLVFIDGNKEHYFEYYEQCLDKSRHGGYLLIDNVLWGGKVTDPRETDRTVRILRDFNAFVNNDLRVENVLLTVRDGLMLIRKR
jgi:predicted O-methyltransferase YrrM